jgi:universal stress protein E
MKRILVGTDFSPAGERAVQVAAAWARRFGAAVRVLHVVPPKRWLIGVWRTDHSTVSAAHRHAGAALKRVAEKLDPSRQLDLSTGLISGAASVTIARAARDFRADLLVVGARGEHEVRLGLPTLGGTALKLLSATSVPLLVVRTPAAEAPGSVLAAVDLSPVSKSVLTWAHASAGERGITVFHAYEAPFASRLNAYGIAKESIDLYSDEEQGQRERELDSLIAQVFKEGAVRRIVARGDPIDHLFEHIRHLEPGLIVLGKHSPRLGTRAARGAGSVSRHTALFAPTNVLIVPPTSSGTSRTSRRSRRKP